MTQNTSPTLEAVKALAPEIASAAEEGERARALLPRIVDQLRQAGIFRMLVPKTYGGDELSQAQVCAVIEALAVADAAAAWTAMVAVGFNMALTRFPRATADAVFANGPDVRLRGALAPMGKAVRVEGGYVVNGRWPFASGPYEPHFVVGGCVVIENGQPAMGPMGPAICLALVPATEATFLDTWDSVGLRGSDSRDFELHDVFVSEDHTANLFDFTRPATFGPPLLNLPFPLVTGPTHSAVCLGVARAALEELGTLAQTKRSAFNPAQTLGESQVFCHRLAELAVRLASLRALTDHQVADLARMVDEREPAGPLVMSRNASWVGYVHQEAADIVDQAFALAGSTPVYSKTPLQRRWRDVHVAAQHFGGSTAQYPAYGALLAGAQPAGPPR